MRDTYQGAEGNGETLNVKAEVPWSAAYGLDIPMWRCLGQPKSLRTIITGSVLLPGIISKEVRLNSQRPVATPNVSTSCEA
ncbi:hypothetical protein [Halobacillus dabanensis]|uniref:hypothetical protein n=1 Tax=Halobacillus dabanensis TaxID=240302 RepID=UPI00111354EC|nr:hypothetical protein [Halobacillus dabanensis]